MAVKVAINGFGRIGRLVLRAMIESNLGAGNQPFPQPKDKLRFAYRIWAEKKTGLVMKLQTLDERHQVLLAAGEAIAEVALQVGRDQLVEPDFLF